MHPKFSTLSTTTSPWRLFVFGYLYFLFPLLPLAINVENCTEKSFVCANSKCIEDYLTCDNFDHCGDGSDESIACPPGCDNNGTLAASGTTVEDSSWWYVCNRSRWRISGCMVNGKRLSVGDTFFGHMSEFWGRCDMLGSSYIRRHLQGCVDYKGNPVKPGTAYLSDPLFWSMCSGTRQLFYVPGEGTIAINTVRRQVIGCFDGSPTPVPDDEQFIQINDPELGMGVAYHCRTAGEIEWPEVVPVACVFRNSSVHSKQLDYVGIGDKCFLVNDSLVYYCTIFAEGLSDDNFTDALVNNTWKYTWHLNWNSSLPQVISELRYNGYEQCRFGETETVQTGDLRPTFRIAFGDTLERIRRLRRHVHLRNNLIDQDVFSIFEKPRW